MASMTSSPTSSRRRTLTRASLALVAVVALTGGTACSRTDDQLDPSQLAASYVKSNGPVSPEYQGTTELRIEGGRVDTVVETTAGIERSSKALGGMQTRELVNAARNAARALAEHPIPAEGCGVGGQPLSLTARYGTEEIIDVSNVIDTEPCSDVHDAIARFGAVAEGRTP
jgi:hypothetical protein